jgi:hypothetical protein
MTGKSMNKISILAALGLVLSGAPVLAGSYPVGGAIPTAPGAVVHTTITPSFSAPVQQTFSAPVVIAPTVTTLIPHDQVFPKDLIDPLLPKLIKDKRVFNSKGIKEVPHFAFNGGASNGATFHAEEGSKIAQISSNEVKLDEGSVLVSLHGPAAIVGTANGKVFVKGEGNILTSFYSGVMRVENISARGVACKVQMDGKAIEGETKVVALAPGYEIVVGDRALANGEIRPADGIARRGQFVFDGNHIAVNEFSVDSIIDSHPIVAAMLNDTTKTDRRCLNEIAKMASVMNFVHGAGGYKPAEGTGIATRPGRNTQ